MAQQLVRVSQISLALLRQDILLDQPVPFHSAAGEDYTTTSRTVTFQPTVTSQIVMVPILNDNRLEGAKQFTAMLSQAAGQVGVVIGAADTATVEITDDDCESFMPLV